MELYAGMDLHSSNTYEIGDVGAADKSAIQRVSLLSYQRNTVLITGRSLASDRDYKI